jgi:hypothetical protein
VNSSRYLESLVTLVAAAFAKSSAPLAIAGLPASDSAIDPMIAPFPHMILSMDPRYRVILTVMIKSQEILCPAVSDRRVDIEGGPRVGSMPFISEHLA